MKLHSKTGKKKKKQTACFQSQGIEGKALKEWFVRLLDMPWATAAFSSQAAWIAAKSAEKKKRKFRNLVKSRGTNN